MIPYYKFTVLTLYLDFSAKISTLFQPLGLTIDTHVSCDSSKVVAEPLAETRVPGIVLLLYIIV